MSSICKTVPATVCHSSLRPGREFDELATNTLDDGFMSSPAAVDGAFFLRTKSHLYRIEEPQAPIQAN